jgi:hypothetical protein
MSNTYKATSVVGEHYFGEGVTEHDLSPVEERDALNSGHLELVPRKYRVLSDNYTAGKQGDVVELALLKENEAALMQGGHIERVDGPKEAPEKTATKAADKKEK